MSNIRTWIGMGKPTIKAWSSSLGRYTYKLPNAPDGKWVCDPLAEQQSSPADREAWYQVKKGCRGTAEAVAGKPYSPSLNAYVGSMVEPPTDAYVPTYTPPPVVLSTAPAPANVQPESSMVRSSATLGTIGTVIGGPIGGTIGALGGLLGGIGSSKCPGPYDYVNGRCVPKSDYAARVGSGESGTSPGVSTPGFGGSLVAGGPCPTGYQWDGAQCKRTGFVGTVERVLPGGDTGYGVDVYGQATVDPLTGRAALVPYTEAVPTRRCPPGAVLNKRGLCVDRRSISNKDRMWPAPPRPPMSASDAKALRRINTLQAKVKRLASKSGFTCKKR